MRRILQETASSEMKEGASFLYTEHLNALELLRSPEILRIHFVKKSTIPVGTQGKCLLTTTVWPLSR